MDQTGNNSCGCPRGARVPIFTYIAPILPCTSMRYHVIVQSAAARSSRPRPGSGLLYLYKGTCKSVHRTGLITTVYQENFLHIFHFHNIIFIIFFLIFLIPRGASGFTTRFIFFSFFFFLFCMSTISRREEICTRNKNTFNN